MQSRTGASGTATTGGAAFARGAQTASADQIRVLYAGDMEVARPQFASEAPGLQLLPLVDALAVPSEEPRFAAGSADVVFIDCGSARVNAAALVDELRDRNVAVPIVLAIDPGVEASAKTALDLQVDDYTIKSPGWLARLRARLSVAVTRSRKLDALSAREQRLRSLLDGAPACLVRLDRDGHILAMNDAARALVGAEQLAAVLGKPLSAFVAPGQIEPLQRYIESVCEGRAGSMELTLTGLSGTQRIVEGSGVVLPPDVAGRTTMLLVIRDITERRRLEESIASRATDNVVDLDGFAEAAARQAQLEQQLEQERTQAAELIGRVRELEVERERVPSNAPQTEAMEKALKEAQAASASLAEQLAAERSRVETMMARVRGVDTEQQNLTAQRAQLEAVRAALLEARARLADEIGRERRAREQLETQCRDQQIAADRLAEQLSAARANVDALTGRLRSMDADHAAAGRSELDSLASALDQARTRHENEVAGERERRQQLEESFRNQQVDRDRLAEQLSVERAQAEAAAVRLRELQDEQAAAAGHRAQLEAQQVALDEARAAVAAELAKEQELRAQLETECRDRRTTCDDLSRQLAAEHTNRETLAARVQDLEAEQLAANAQRAQIEALQGELDATRGRLDSLQQSNEETRARLESDVARERQRSEQLEIASRDAQASSDRLEQDLTAERTQRDALAKRVRDLELEAVLMVEQRLQIETLERQIVEARASHDAALAQERGLRDQLESAIREKDAECRRLEDERDALTRKGQDHDQALHLHAQRVLEAESQQMRLSAEKEVREGAMQLLRDEVDRLLAERRTERQELVRTLQKYDEIEEVANQRGQLCAELGQALEQARLEFVELTEWARVRSQAIADRAAPTVDATAADPVANP